MTRKNEVLRADPKGGPIASQHALGPKGGEKMATATKGMTAKPEGYEQRGAIGNMTASTARQPIEIATQAAHDSNNLDD